MGNDGRMVGGWVDSRSGDRQEAKDLSWRVGNRKGVGIS